MTKDNVMRLDFNKDGKIGLDDLKQSMFGLCEFLKNFDVIENTTQIKCKLYEDAISHMQKELEEEQKLKEMREQAKIDDKE
jgi:ribosome-associated protein YbcJ (S4-like RNA binding protein)